MILATLREWLRVRVDEVPESRIVAAVSGGADSTALAAGLALAAGELKLRACELLILAHYNHRLRSDSEHDRDREVVSRLASRLEVPLVTESADAGEIAAAAGRDGGIESAARTARYGFLVDVCRAAGARTVCAGHHADDQVETVLMRLAGGQMGTQLAGIPHRRVLADGVLLCRPLLNTWRLEIDQFIAEHNLEWSDDRSNDDSRYRRNLVRRGILPVVERHWPAVRGDLQRLALSMEALRRDAREEGGSVPIIRENGSARMERRAFYLLGSDARLDLAYETMRGLGLLSRRDRPGHRFFEPLLGSDPGGDRRLIGSRGMQVDLEGGYLVFRGDIVRPPESRYLGPGSADGFGPKAESAPPSDFGLA